MPVGRSEKDPQAQTEWDAVEHRDVAFTQEGTKMSAVNEDSWEEATSAKADYQVTALMERMGCCRSRTSI